MQEKLKKTRESYQTMLNQTEQEIVNLNNSLKIATTKREQLKGAIFALDTVATPDAQEQEAAPAAPQETVEPAKKPKKSAQSEKGAQ